MTFINETKIQLDKNIRYIKGVGEARAKLFEKLGIYTLRDVLSFFPRDYEDRSQTKKIIDLQDGDSCSFAGFIRYMPEDRRIRKGLSLQKAVIADDTGMISATWFNQSYVIKQLTMGKSYIFFGKIKKTLTKTEVLNPIFEVNDGSNVNLLKIVPIYRLTARVTQNIIRKIERNVLNIIDNKLTETIPKRTIEKHELEEINKAYINIHFPDSFEELKIARDRLVFEELLVLQLSLLFLKNKMINRAKGTMFNKPFDLDKAINNLPFHLTPAQEKVLGEISKDMESDKIMNRLVQGDVGSGKTVIAVLAMLKAHSNGYQSAIMVPTEILAQQHLLEIRKLSKGSNVRVELLSGKMTKKNKEEINKDIKSGEINIIVGTHALIQGSVEYKKLGLVITDEQHRFGVQQRTELSKKGLFPDVLVMTATPIPRTLALILYGDLDISIINTMPPGRKPVKTYAVDESKKQRVYNFVKEEIKKGRQCYIVCPLVEESEVIDAKAAEQYAESLKNKEFKEYSVGLIHGRLKSSEKEEIMNKFFANEINVLVSTTVIEVGMNVINASVMIVENAERFGLAQLHQLRGRVGRGEYQSYCILFNDAKNEIATKRMKVMSSTTDGFVISEQDLKIRGPGEFFGTKQHGLPDLKIANLYEDLEVLKTAQEEALRISTDDPFLQKEENLTLREQIKNMFDKKIDKMEDI